MSATAPVTRPLAEALPRIDLAPRIARQQQLSKLFELTHDDDRWTFRLRAQPARGRWAHVTVHERPCALLADDEPALAVGERQWHDYSGDARQLAFAVANEALLGAVGRLLGDAPTPAGIVAAPADVDPALAGAVLEFEWSPAQAEAPVPAWRGALALTDDLLMPLLDRASVRAEAHSTQPVSAVPVPVSVHCDGPVVTAATLGQCAPGDTIVLGRAERLLARMCARTTGNTPLPLALRAAEDGIHVFLSQDPANMSDNASAEPPAAQAASDAALTGDIPVRLAIQTGAVTVTLSELSAVEPGVVLPLEAPVAGTNVTVLANGAPIGEGELVAAGEKLAVCITRWRPDGL